MKTLLASFISIIIGVLSGFILNKMNFHDYYAGYTVGCILTMSYYISLFLLKNTH